jgi:transposase InsO family protein
MGPALGESTSETLQFPKFNGTNYHSWADNMKAALQAKSVWGVTSGRERRPPHPPDEYPGLYTVSSPTAKGESPTSVRKDGQNLIDVLQSKGYLAWEQSLEKFERWLNKDDMAMGLIRNAIEYAQRETIIDIGTSTEMWNHLRQTYVDQQSGVNIHFYYQELYSKKWDGHSSMSDHIGFYLNIRRRFIEAGHHIDNSVIVNSLLLSLPHTPTWEVVKQNLLYNQSRLTLENVTAELLAVFDRILHEDDAKGMKSVALVSKGDNDASGSKKDGKDGKGKKKGKKKGKREPKPDDICHNCQEKGHWSNTCSKPKKPKPVGNANVAVESTSTSDSTTSGTSREVGTLYMASKTTEIPSGLLLDSAATCHMISDRSYFVEYEACTHQHISVGGFNDVPIAGFGKIRFRASSPTGHNNITLDDALYIPNLGANLISLGKLQRSGAEIRGLTNGIALVWRGAVAFNAILIGTEGTLYRIQSVGPGDHYSYLASGTPASMRLWHRRMAHLGPRGIKDMAENNLVKGLRIDDLEDFDRLCDGCANGKSQRNPFPKASETSYAPLELVVMDLFGPIKTPTWNGYQYALVVVDVGTRFPVGRLLKSKSDVGKEVRDVLMILERQVGRKVKRLRSDVGNEFVNGAMDEFCRRNGIIHETTIPYNPEQNGIAERAIAIFLQMTRCMLWTAKMDLRYWGEAFIYAVHIRSISITFALKGKVPYEAFYGRKPDVSHLRIFGSYGWAHVPKQVREGKLDSRAVRVRMLGWWSDESKGYRLEDLENGKVIASRDVQFDEDDRPSNVAQVDISLPHTTPDEVIDLTDLEDTPPTSPRPQTPSTPSVGKPASASTPTSDQSMTPMATPSVPDERPVTPETPREMVIPSAPKRTKKWESLPPREPSERTRRQTERYGEGSGNMAFVANYEPTYVEAMESTEATEWQKSLDSEHAQLVRKGVVEEVDSVPEGKKAVGSKVVLRRKLDEHGNPVKYKARIVAQGFSQVPGIDYHETFSSVAKFTTLRVLLTIAATLNWEIHQIDVVGAYLQGELDEEIYMRIPDGVRHEKRFWKLKKALYGLKQAGRQWKNKLDEVLTKNGFTRAQSDDCLYILRENGKIILEVLVYVDDMAVTGPDIGEIIRFKHNLTNDFEITNLGEIRHILGFHVERDRKNRRIYLNQTAYIETILHRFKMQDSYPVSTPLAVNHNLSTSQSPKTNKEVSEYAEYSKGIHYLSLVGSLLYATQTRPDIQFAVGLVAQFAGNPGIAHLSACKRILRYLKGTSTWRLELGGNRDVDLRLIGWGDSNWAQDVDDRKSVCGYSFNFAGGTVSWSSKKQPVVATSTVEAEYIASANATKEAIWLRTLLQELDIVQSSATIIYSDNQGCIALSNNPVSHSRAKHIDIRYHFVRDRVAKGEVKLEYTPTEMMIADIFTKALPRESFQKCRRWLGIGPSIESDTSLSGSVEN